MKTVLIVEDRDTAYLVLDITAVPENETRVDLLLEGVTFEDIPHEKLTVWLQNEDSVQLKVVPRESYDFDAAGKDGWFPIPTPVLVLDQADLEREALDPS